ncbi:MAG: DNA-processing protein DprA [Lachnospiraceae bacterium]|nr:DNA-processing protein DprA [Lachnospiraceae bacterium]
MKYKYWFNEIEGLGNVARNKLIEKYGSAEGVYNEFNSKEDWVGILNVKQVENIEEARKYNLDLKYREFASYGESMVTVEDPEYPRDLFEVYDHPYGLYFLGELPEAQDEMVAMVGARCCSAYGKTMASEIGYNLGANGFVVVSGMAKGIDSASHEGCLQAGGRTVAVLGCGVDICYPAMNRKLYQKIIENGCVISEYPHGRQPLAGQFPSRNRIISGMSKSLVVVEARKKSGSLITVDFALEQGKDIYVVPGRITDKMSEGCNRLINQGAQIITSSDDFIQSLRECDLRNLNLNHNNENTHKDLTPEEHKIYDLIDYYPTSLNVIIDNSGMDYFEVLSIIIGLVEKGFIYEKFKNQYVISKNTY